MYSNILTDLEYHNVTVSVSPVQESYEIGSRMTLRCIAPRIYGNFVLPQFYYRLFSSRRQRNIYNTYSSTGSATYSFTIPTTHPKSADYHCNVYYRNQLLGSGKTVIRIKGSIHNLVDEANFNTCACCRYFTEHKF